MAWGVSRSFPRAILHIDGDSFFASCEVAKNPQLRGRAVITGKERGIVSACTYEAKRRGVTRGMQLHEVRKLVPDAVILPSDYETYSLFSNRMYKIVRRYTPEVEEYSIDECFADLTGMRRVNKMGYGEVAEAVGTHTHPALGSRAIFAKDIDMGSVGHRTEYCRIPHEVRRPERVGLYAAGRSVGTKPRIETFSRSVAGIARHHCV